MTRGLIRYVCPECGGPRAKDALRCHHCRPPSPPRARAEDSVHTLGRTESIVTFRDDVSGQTRTLHCFGRNVPSQIADGLARLPDGEWRVVCRSTPASILQDLRGRLRPPRTNYGEAR